MTRSVAEIEFQANRQHPRRLEAEPRVSVFVGVIGNHLPLLHQSKDFVGEDVTRRRNRWRSHRRQACRAASAIAAKSVRRRPPRRFRATAAAAPAGPAAAYRAGSAGAMSVDGAAATDRAVVGRDSAERTSTKRRRAPSGCPFTARRQRRREPGQRLVDSPGPLGALGGPLRDGLGDLRRASASRRRR